VAIPPEHLAIFRNVLRNPSLAWRLQSRLLDEGGPAGLVGDDMLELAIGGAGSFCAVVLACWAVTCGGVLYAARLEDRALNAR
jgi:hypothetical protein